MNAHGNIADQAKSSGVDIGEGPGYAAWPGIMIWPPHRTAHHG
ncbi:hypothetical protein [Streptomyces sp. NPDC060205]